MLTAATSGLFVPQMLNYQATGAVSFRKGCYTGQEVVARLQYRGKPKRWLHHLRLPGSAPPPPGAELTSPEGEAATVVAAVADGDRLELLAVASQSALASGRLLLDGRETVFAEIPLPYGDALERS
ncbi:MAG: hypothetical protein KatS3mg124_0954 [Porticoccaceae bacterium]|nr:MAG: hypothetical protein KatS3mg124_0954 [Porticoccaceae bacterium]